MFLGKGVLKICSKFTGEHPCRSVISIKLLCNFIEIALRHGCSAVNLLHIFKTPFLKNTSDRLLLHNEKLLIKCSFAVGVFALRNHFFSVFSLPLLISPNIFKTRLFNSFSYGITSTVNS